jgi:hypothetical protein
MSDAAETVPAPEEPATMLEVHPPHQAPHSWKDFFLQIVTITIGLLIAIGLEQSVEYVHHRIQAGEMAAQLRDDWLQNHNRVVFDLAETDSVMHAVKANIDALEAIRAGSGKTEYVPVPLPNWIGFIPQDAAWLMMRDSGLLPLMPDLLVQNSWRIEAANDVFGRAKWDAAASRQRLGATLLMYGKAGSLSGAQRESLERAFYEYDQTLIYFRQVVVGYDLANNTALKNQPMSVPGKRNYGFRE